MQKKENCINKKITDSAAKLFLLDFASTFCLGVFRCKGDRSVSSEHSKNTKCTLQVHKCFENLQMRDNLLPLGWL